LKKKRTKDVDSPTSPIRDNTPVTPTSSTRSSGGFHLHKTKTNDSALSASNSATAATPTAAQPKAADSMNPATYTQQPPQQPQQVASPHTQPQLSHNVASIQNLIHPDNDAPTKNGTVQFQTQPLNQARVTKGKYSLTDFQIQRTLGTGSFGRVHLVQSKHNQRFYAVKVLKKAQVVKMKQVEHTNDERRMLQQVKHPFLITLWGTFQDSKNLYMVMDFVEGGELFSLLRKSQVSETCIENGMGAHTTSAFQIRSPSFMLPKSHLPSTTYTRTTSSTVI
jgi:protein kinase A